MEAPWSLNGEPFDVVQQEFQRLSLRMLHHRDDEPAQEAA
jgi:hypothetical protein